MARFTSKGTYITDTDDVNSRSYDMSNIGDVMAITRMINGFADTSAKDAEIRTLNNKLNSSEGQRNEALIKLIDVESDLKDLRNKEATWGLFVEANMIEHCNMRDLIHRLDNCLVCLPIAGPDGAEELVTTCSEMIQEEFTEEQIASFAPAILHNYNIDEDGKLHHILGDDHEPDDSGTTVCNITQPLEQ